MFKSAFVRGVQSAMVNSGHIAFPSEDAAIKVADYISDRLNFDPTEGVSREVTASVGQALFEASNYLKGQPGFKVASFHKLATVDDLNKLAHYNVIDLMQKAAEGSTIEGGDKGNAEPNSAEGKMDAAARPVGYAEGSLGKSDVDTRPGAVGKEQEQPNAPANSPSGSNSVTEQSRTASLAQMLRKVAEGSTILGGDKGNAEPQSAEGKMDAADRPAGYAVLPSQGSLGELMNQVKGPATIGREVSHPNGPANTPGGSNSVIQHSAKAASADPYVELFKKTAAEVVPYIPSVLGEDAKIAHVRACMGLTTLEKAAYLTSVHRDLSAKVAGEMPAFIQEKIDAKKEKGDGDKDEDDKEKGKSKHNPFASMNEEKKEEKKEEKDEEKKEAHLRDHFRRLQNAIK